MSQHPAFIQPLPKSKVSTDAPDPGRRRAAAVVKRAAAIITANNGESETFAGTWPTNFSKGLAHDAHGVVDAQAYTEFFEEVAEPTYTDNTGNRIALFDMPAYSGPFRTKASVDGRDFRWRAWEGPISGQQFGLEGSDASVVGIAPAPRLGSDELAAEMAEVYAMAHLRDVPFETIRGGSEDADKVTDALGQMPWFQPNASPKDANGQEISKVSAARRIRDGGALTSQTLFRGSSQGCAQGPYLSQFLLQGHDPLVGGETTLTRLPSDQFVMAQAAPVAGMVPFGAQGIDQRIAPQAVGVDYLRDWAEWLDVQNGADTTCEQAFTSDGLKFIETPRDLATFVHFDTIYQAYLNACLLMLNWGTATDEGLPEPGHLGLCGPFATLGGSNILTLLAETATRALRAIKCQTFQIHNRARPEKLGSVASLVANGHGAVLGTAERLAEAHLSRLESATCDGFSLIDAVAAAPDEKRFSHNANSHKGLPSNDRNLLLPMAFPEGSPMTPAYGAGHAAVAGACVTILKAFFRTHTADGTRVSLADAGAEGVYVPAPGGQTLVNASRAGDDVHSLTLNGELNKLAANIAIGRNMAGVNYYSDYFDSVRMGERIAVGILAEQTATCSDAVSMSLETFDGDCLSIVGNGNQGSEIRIRNSTPEMWWTRHLPEQAGW
ncbi:bromoperoxidase [Rhodobacteraceae bacterium B1Z28]|uniref:Bromoperoxidase n=1 Tax=Ruegeria haliotis TaxID=2747601 RepID=A0ABX2PVJ0_9RHOB|nr:bromoperoxidase [Ruegeria haliotis]NVO57824.1 bromoperoxidase [Ruegeria haliotis]